MDNGAITGAAAAAMGVTVFGVVTGLTYDVLLAGFAGGLVSLSYVGNMSWPKVFSTLFSSTLTAGYAAPIVLAVTAKWIDVGPIAASGLAVAGFFTGLAAQTALPVFLSWIKRRGNAQDAV